MEIKDVYLFTIYYNQTSNNKSDEKLIYWDSDDIYQLSNLPQNTVFVCCEKLVKETKKFDEVKNYAFGRELTDQDLEEELANNRDEKANGYIAHLLDSYSEIEGVFCIFKNKDKICAYNISHAACEVMSEEQIKDGRVMKNVKFDESDYLDLE